MPRVPLLLIKEQVLVAHEAHFAGGIHLFNSLSTALSTYFDVHVFTTARRGLAMHHAVTDGLLGQLQRTYDRGELISWTTSCGIQFHVAIAPEPSPRQPTQESASIGLMQHTSSSSGKSMSVYETLIAAISSVAEHHQFNCKLLLDVDSLQHAVVSCSSSSNHPASCSSSCNHPASCSSCSNHPASCSSSNNRTPVQSHRQQQQQQQDHLPSRTALELEHSPTHPFMHALLQKLKPNFLSCCYCCCCGTPLRCSAHQQPDATSGFYSAMSTLDPLPKASKPLDLLVLVQNIHHLPFGPCGTAPRTLELLQAWCQISGVICVSHFVQGYLEQHVLPLTGLSSQRVYVMHPAAVGVFGKGPWPDLGTEAASRIWVYCWQQQQQQDEEEVAQDEQYGVAPQRRQQQQEEKEQVAQERLQGATPQQQQQQQKVTLQQQQQQQQQQVCPQQQVIARRQHNTPQQSQQQPQQQQQRQPQHKPVIGMLKCSREKGSNLFLALAERLPEYDFLAVCAEPEQLQSPPPAAAAVAAATTAGGDSSPAAAAAAAAESKASGMRNLTLVPPEADVSGVLRQMSVVLVPSVLHEAFGLVVLDAVLHGIPVVTSDAGALAEAAAGAAAAVVPVRMVEFIAAKQIEAKNDKDKQDLALNLDLGIETAPGNLPMEDKGAHVPQMTAAAAAITTTAVTSPSNAQQQILQQHNMPDKELLAQWLTSRPQCQVLPSMTSSDLEPWIAAVKHVVSSRDVYLELSRRGREVAHGVVGSAEQQLSQLVSWIGMSR